MKQIIFSIVIFLGLNAAHAQDDRVLASSPHSSDQFGYSVSISGDYCVIGAPNVDLYATSEEAAYIFHWNGASWSRIKKLTDPEDDGYDDFGQAVSISGDYCVVGVPDKYINSNNEGCVYLFARNQGGADNWGLVKKIYAYDHAGGDYFGKAVALYGDYLIVGAYQNWDNGIGGGSAYIYYRNAGGTDNWGLVKKIRPSNTDDNSQEFGGSVDIYGDYVIVGARAYGGEGRAYLYYRNQGGADNWGEIKVLKGSDTDGADNFGKSVTIWGDYLAVGANNHDEETDGTSYNIGSVYVFYRNHPVADNWGEVNQFLPLYTKVQDMFGISVDMYNQFLVVGSSRERVADDADRVGFIYSYHLQNDHTWSFVKRHNSGTDRGDEYGFSVAVAQTHSVAGVPFDSVFVDSADVGSAYIMDNAAVLGLVEDGNLPVELVFFTAQAGDGMVTLTWSTQSEINNEAFVIERSTDGRHFLQLAEVKGHGTTSSLQRYSFEDRAVVNGITYYYRLADRDFSGVVTYHTIIKATPKAHQLDSEPAGEQLAFRLYPPYPNPFNPQTTIRFDIPPGSNTQGMVRILIYNALGRQVRELYRGAAAAGSYRLSWDGKDQNDLEQPAGIYFVTMKTTRFYARQKLLLIR